MTKKESPQSANSTDHQNTSVSSSRQEYYHHHHHYRQPKIKTSSDNLNANHLTKNESDGASDKIKNYHRLSNSINNVFTNLLQELDKQKNKDYAQNLNKSIIIQSLYSNEGLDTSLVKNQQKKLSNSYDEFNKENDTSLNAANVSSNGLNFDLPQKSYASKFDLIESNNMSDGNNRINSSDVKNTAFQLDNVNSLNENDTSLLERYLTNEQFVAYKHSQVENMLHKYHQINLLLDQDYSIIDYILNQEGISNQTFKQLIREKFFNLEWSENLLNKLHEIINQPNEAENSKIG